MRKNNSRSALIVLGILAAGLIVLILGLLLTKPKQETPEKNAGTPMFADSGLRLLMQAEIIENSRSLESESRFVCADLEPISIERQDDTAKVYALTYYAEYERGEGGSAKLAFSESAPAVFIAEKDGAAPTGWRLSDFLQPGLGSNYSKDVSELFPKSLEKAALECDTSKLTAKCERLAEEYCGKTGLVYPLSDFGEAQSVKKSYYCPDPAHYAIESTRIDAAFTLDFNALKFLFADDYSPVNADGGSFRYRERTGEFALTFAGDDGETAGELIFRSVGDILIFDGEASTLSSALFEDGAVFYPVNFAFTQSAAFGEASADIDGDGAEENCYLGLGASVKRDILTIYSTNGARLECYNSFACEFSEPEFELLNGVLKVKATDMNGKLHRFAVSTAVNRVFLTEDGEDLPVYLPKEYVEALRLSPYTYREGTKVSKVFYCVDPGDKLGFYLGAANIALADDKESYTFFYSPAANTWGTGSFRYEDDGSRLILDAGTYHYTFAVHGDMLVFDENLSNAYEYFGSFTNGAIFTCTPPEAPIVG
ncbi:MAG: hypothetical protein IKI64_09265 [Clostridia bacterium]|nr:hypothetical protein [Clostridia bacterium]